jgi:hypothetical protein
METKIAIGNFQKITYNTLAIVSLFCDKDYQYIPSLLESIHKKVFCSYEVVLVDNREKNKDIPIPEIEEFFKVHKGRCISKGENLCQLAAKKWALEYISSEYVWFIDGDDDICGAISDALLASCRSDIIAFNYVFNNESEKRIIYQESFYKNKTIRNKFKFRTDLYLEHSCVTCWNKWFKRSLLLKIFKNIPDHLKVSCNEDVYICCAALNNATSIDERRDFIYVNNPHRGISNNNTIDNIDRFKMIIQGWKDSMKLFKIEFPFNTKLFNYEDKRTCDINYFLGRMYISKKEIWEQEIHFLLNVFDAKEILSCLSKDNITYKNSNNNIMEFKSFVEKKLKNLL